MSETNGTLRPRWRNRLHTIIFEADTPLGKAFDVSLMVLIVVSVLAVMLESVKSVAAVFGTELYIVEWVLTVLFSIEYVLRLLSVRRPIAYARSFFGIVDLLALLPTYLSLLIPGTQSLLVIRALRLLRVFRVLKLAQFVVEARFLRRAMVASARKIVVFLGVVLTLVIIMGSLMYLIEGEENGFTSIPRGVYWAIVTVTTVGYGDISPKTVPGQILASGLMIMGYAILAVPTGIVTGELVQGTLRPISTQNCPSCSGGAHEFDAKHCKHCGAKL